MKGMKEISKLQALRVRTTVQSQWIQSRNIVNLMRVSAATHYNPLNQMRLFHSSSIHNNQLLSSSTNDQSTVPSQPINHDTYDDEYITKILKDGKVIIVSYCYYYINL